MSINLEAPLHWSNANADELRMLGNLQGNILKGHGRHFTANVFFAFDADKPQESRRLLRELANYHLISAHRQLLQARAFKASGVEGGPFCHLALSFKGYQALDLEGDAPDDDDFRKGMQHADSISALSDPSTDSWDAPFQATFHAILLAAAETESATGKLTCELVELIEDAGGQVLHIQRGKAIFNAVGEGIEHFGYVDGRSQPLMLVEDIADEAEVGLSRWNPAFPLKTALVPDPGAPDGFSFGSFFVFRKLEQDVRQFKLREQEIADILELTGEDRELAGAMLVGRFEDGTPVTLSDRPRGQKLPNDFNYAEDPGSRCPFHSHIRKTNPRGSGGAEPEEDERSHLMARRGIPYEDTARAVHPAGLPTAHDLADFTARVAPLLPTGGVGLLFMAYNGRIRLQFRFTQNVWADNPEFPIPGKHGIDPVIGQGVNEAGVQVMPKAWDDPSAGTRDDCPFAGFVTMKGGEYFFSPSLTFLRNL